MGNYYTYRAEFTQEKLDIKYVNKNYDDLKHLVTLFEDSSDSEYISVNSKNWDMVKDVCSLSADNPDIKFIVYSEDEDSDILRKVIFLNGKAALSIGQIVYSEVKESDFIEPNEEWNFNKFNQD